MKQYLIILWSFLLNQNVLAHDVMELYCGEDDIFLPDSVYFREYEVVKRFTLEVDDKDIDALFWFTPSQLINNNIRYIIICKDSSNSNAAFVIDNITFDLIPVRNNRIRFVKSPIQFHFIGYLGPFSKEELLFTVYGFD